MKPLSKMPRWYLPMLLSLGIPLVIVGVFVWITLVIFDGLQRSQIMSLPNTFGFQLIVGLSSFFITVICDLMLRNDDSDTV